MLDVGTNSIKFHVGERLPERGWTRGSSTGPRSRASARACGKAARSAAAPGRARATAIKGMVEEARTGWASARIVGVATAWLRMAPNGERGRGGGPRARPALEITAIPGDEESRLAFLAVKVGLGLADGSLAVFDTGGGSTQLTFGHGDARRRALQRRRRRRAVHRAVRPRRASSRTTRLAARRAPRSSPDLARRRRTRRRRTRWSGMGGAVTNMAAVKHAMASLRPGRGSRAASSIARRSTARSSSTGRRDADARRDRSSGLQPKRADVILAGRAASSGRSWTSSGATRSP